MLSREQRWEQKRVAFLSSRGSGFGSQPPPQLAESSEGFSVSFDAAASALREDLRGAAAQQSMLSQNAAALAAGPRRAVAASVAAPSAFATARAPGSDAVDAAAASAGYGRGYGTAPLVQPQAPYGAPAAASVGYGAALGASYGPSGNALPQYSAASAPGLPPSRILSREEAWAAKARVHAGEQHPRLPAEQQYAAQPPPQQHWQQAPPLQYMAAPQQQQQYAVPFAGGADSAPQSRASSRGSAGGGLGGVGASLVAGGLPPRPTASGASAYAGAVSIGGPMSYGGGQRAGMAMESTGSRRQPPGGGSTLRFG